MNFLGGSVRIGQLFGINLRVHMLFLIWIGWTLLNAPAGGRVEEGLFLGMLFGIVLVHELGHCFGARMVGGEAHDIMMWPLGGLAYAAAPMRPWPQFVTVAAGPAVNVLFCLLTAGAMLVATGGQLAIPINPLSARFAYFGSAPLPDWIDYAVIFYRVNLFLLAFNLLPIYPLDGGQLFHAILWPFLGLRQATMVACYVGLAGAVFLGVMGLRGMGGGMLFFIALFGGFTCWQRLRMAQAGMLIEDDRFTVYEPTRRPGFFKRLFGRRGGRNRPVSPVDYSSGRPSPNPNPGAWETRMTEQQRRDAEVDRILKKVSERGVQSLSYVERQTLEQATRERQARERAFERETKL
jgi:Zn-dependent protease